MNEVIRITRRMPAFGEHFYESAFASSSRVLSAWANGDSLEIFLANDYSPHSLIDIRFMLAGEGSIIPSDTYLCFPVMGTHGAMLIQYTGS